jgi:hypothetical protein
VAWAVMGHVHGDACVCVRACVCVCVRACVCVCVCVRACVGHASQAWSAKPGRRAGHGTAQTLEARWEGPSSLHRYLRGKGGECECVHV